jgi:(2R)-ethylmalonyl-CoA mutase
VPPEDEKVLLGKGVARVFTPKDYELTEIMDGIVTLVRETHGLPDVSDR